MNQNSTIDYSKKNLPSVVNKIGLLLLAAGLVVVILSFLIDPVRGSFNNLILLLFLSSIGVGSLFLVAVEYLGGAVWSVPFRRITEFFASTILILPVIAIPLYFNLEELFHWTHPGDDAILLGKEAYLNIPFFTIRMILFFAVWIVFYYFLTRNSKKQDVSKKQSLTTINTRISAAFMPFFAITITFAAIDWMMSLEAHWFSTIFGVYYFSGTILAALAATTFAVVLLNEKGYFIKGITRDHYYSLGALLFAFTNFWAYIVFSQYMLIWYANLPEETIWFLQRWQGGWMYISIGLIIVHFVVPYFGLLSQPSKMNPKRLLIMSVWILFAHVYDLYWIIMPSLSPEGIIFGWMELGFPLVAVGLVILIFTMKAKNENIAPVGDPKLKRGLNFRL